MGYNFSIAGVAGRTKGNYARGDAPSVGMEGPYDLPMPNGPLEVFSRLIRKGVPVRRLGSAAMDLCWVAAGRFDGFFEHKLNAWDSAAGFLIVEEAGGRVSDFSGKKYSPYQPQIAATNGRIHDELLKWIDGSITAGA